MFLFPRHCSSWVKRGTVRNLQRYQCKSCGCNFTNTPPRGKPAAMKALALMLYTKSY
jgi:transposase-like protein